MKKLVRWANTNPDGTRDEQGYWMSVEGRFEISPNHRHTIYPDSFTVQDNLRRVAREGVPFGVAERTTFDRIGDAKAWAEARAQADLSKAIL